MVEKAGAEPEIKISVGGGQDLAPWCVFCKWWSLVNGGYAIYARFLDPNLARFTDIANEKYLREARKRPLEVKYRFRWRVTNKETAERTAYLTDLDARIGKGPQSSGWFEFIAIDPPSWYLNWGDGDGSVWEGNVSKVIKDVVQKYAPGITAEVGESKDNKKNKWHMMRQDPKTFIMSLIDWSASVTNKKTQWIVASVDDKIIIKEQAELKSRFFGDYSVNALDTAGQNVLHWHVMEQNYLTNLQTVLETSGISAVSGLYCDKENPITKDKVRVYDERTGNKKNVNLKSDQSFKKPTDLSKGWTYIHSIPEDSSGALGIKYQDYIDGRPRHTFLNMLNMLLRMKITVAGNHEVHDSSDLGISTLNLMWVDYQGAPYMFNGKWLVYGFEHVFTRARMWVTNFYIARLDYDAAAQKVG